MSQCPRTITTKKGKQRVVRCRSWSCPTCAGHKRAAIIAAARTRFTDGCTALRMRGGDPQRDDVRRVWARVRARFPGMRYIAVIEPAPDEHLHALCTHVDGAQLHNAAYASGATSVECDTPRTIPGYVDYILDKRADRSAPRIMHSRDLTRHLKEPTHADQETERTRAWKARDEIETRIREADAQARAQARAQAEETHAQAEEESPRGREGAQAAHGFPPPTPTPGTGEQPPAPATVPDAADVATARTSLQALTIAARALAQHLGCNVTFTFTVNP